MISATKIVTLQIYRQHFFYSTEGYVLHHFQIVIGAQWGDEGKGKWIDQLSKSHDIVVRYQGGNNAGHTLYVDHQKHIFHLLPSGILHDHITCVLAAGVVIDPVVLCQEMHQIENILNLTCDRLWISSKAHVITPWHIALDTIREQKRTSSIGTTKRGIGPTYADLTSRIGCPMSTFVDTKKREEWLKSYIMHTPECKQFIEEHPDLWKKFADAAIKLKPYVCYAEMRIREALKQKKRVLCEGAQGTLLDLSHGTYPYVTSSHTIAAGALTSIGIGLKFQPHVIAIAKAYCTRVGEGPFPTELTDDIGQQIAEKGQEVGATTSRPRRCGWLDAVALRYACEINSADEIYLNKMDILSGLSEIKLCTAYHHPKLGTITYIPDEDLKDIRPIYEVFSGWKHHLPSSGKKIQDLPKQALAYIQRIEEFCGIPITHVGIGPSRDEYLC